MVDFEDDPPPQRKRKVETFESLIFAPEENRDPRLLPGWESDEDTVDPREEECYRQFDESDGFDVDNYPLRHFNLMMYECLTSSKLHVDAFLYGRLGIHCHNLQKGTNLQFVCLEKYNTLFVKGSTFYITLEVFDPASNSHHTFQTAVYQDLTCYKEKLRTETEICRLKSKTRTPVSGLWKDEAVDDFYKGDMPVWYSDDALTLDNKLQNCYKVRVQDLDLAGTECLRLYCEIALYEKAMVGECRDSISKSAPPLEMKQIFVQTLENVSPIWNAMNAIFYISFRPSGYSREYSVVIRKTMDGIADHLRLETKVVNVKRSVV